MVNCFFDVPVAGWISEFTSSHPVSLYIWKSGFTLETMLLAPLTNRVFSHDVTAAILVSQNNETAAMLVSQTNPLGVELFSYETLSFVATNLHRCWAREWKHPITLCDCLLKKLKWARKSGEGGWGRGVGNGVERELDPFFLFPLSFQVS